MGTIFAELMLRIPYLAGESDLDQLKTIFRALGTPTEDDWPGHTKLPNYVAVGQFPKTPLRDLFSAATPEALNLLSKCLIFEPRKRISARSALDHPYFTSMPYPTHPSKLPKPLTVTSRAAEEVDGSVDLDGAPGPAVRPVNPNRLKRKAISPGGTARSVARRLDFSALAANSSP
jgi:cyclin-dependent kinase 7